MSKNFRKNGAPNAGEWQETTQETTEEIRCSGPNGLLDLVRSKFTLINARVRMFRKFMVLVWI